MIYEIYFHLLRYIISLKESTHLHLAHCPKHPKHIIQIHISHSNKYLHFLLNLLKLNEGLPNFLVATFIILIKGYYSYSIFFA